MSDFKFQPMQHIKIHVYDLNFSGRIVRCIKEQGCTIYDIQYVFEGQLKRAEFFEDEVTDANT